MKTTDVRVIVNSKCASVNDIGKKGTIIKKSDIEGRYLVLLDENIKDKVHLYNNILSHICTSFLDLIY